MGVSVNEKREGGGGGAGGACQSEARLAEVQHPKKGQSEERTRESTQETSLLALARTRIGALSERRAPLSAHARRHERLLGSRRLVGRLRADKGRRRARGVGRDDGRRRRRLRGRLRSGCEGEDWWTRGGRWKIGRASETDSRRTERTIPTDDRGRCRYGESRSDEEKERFCDRVSLDRRSAEGRVQRGGEGGGSWWGYREGHRAMGVERKRRLTVLGVWVLDGQAPGRLAHAGRRGRS